MQPPNPVSIPPDVDITMLSTDYLQFTFTEAGVFCSVDADDFTPSLPDGQTFAAGDTWPDPITYPNGAQPTADKDSKYKYKTDGGACGPDPTATTSKTIQVGSSVPQPTK
ncbi:MAG TPA: hypothetical protein VM554_08555 [Acidisarcina sp.]|nr:hypothetical protein [Acidisarcina sp.]